MANDEKMYQTLAEFLAKPFGAAADLKEEQRLESKYKVFSRLIKFVEYSVLDDAYYIHLHIPSESDPQKQYDVVIQFFPVNDEIKKSINLENYVVNFFSNSPSFVYHYAVLYKIHGYMIDALQEKLDPEYADTLPEKSNKDMKMSYDKSLYFGCRFLYDNRLFYLSKFTLNYNHKVPFHTMVEHIKFNKDVLGKTGREIEQQAREEQRKDAKDASNKRKVVDTTNLPEDNEEFPRPFKPKKAPIPKKGSVRSTMKEPRNIFKKASGKKPKKTAGRSTRHRVPN